MFATVEPAPPDPILGLTAAFKADPAPHKINLGVGVYKDAAGETPVLDCVREAERRLAESAGSKNYLPIEGDAAYGKAVQRLLFVGELAGSARVRTCHTPGGTGALRVVADYLHACHPSTTLWLSDPTWVNHPAIFAAAGVPTAVYPYFDAARNGLDFDGMLAALRRVPAGDAVLLHGCCHNPSGVDPTAEQWAQIAAVLAERKALPVIDFAYQGFGDGLEEDAAGLRAVAAACDEFVVCSSYSKNFGLYNERVGALTIVAGEEKAADAVLSQVRVAIRRNYSNPPAHGGQIVTTILGDAALTKQWHGELAAMRDRINDMRRLFVETLARKAPGRDFSFIVRQRGMFSFSGLSKDQVARLKQEHALYIVGSGRINVAGMTPGNMDRLTDAIASVL